MKRQIKFRGKTTANGHWVYGSLISYSDNAFVICNRKSQPWVQPETIGQFTGLLDRFGTEIYEGDVVEVISFYTSDFDRELGRIRAVIEYDKTHSSFFATNKSARYAMTCASSMEVIGNIHDKTQS